MIFDGTPEQFGWSAQDPPCMFGDEEEENKGDECDEEEIERAPG